MGRLKISSEESLHRHQVCMVVRNPFIDYDVTTNSPWHDYRYTIQRESLIKTKSGGSPYGPTHVSLNEVVELSDEEKTICLSYGKRFGEIVRNLSLNN